MTPDVGPGLPAVLAAGVRGLAYFGGLWSHLRRPVTLPEARATLSRRLERREADLLLLLRESLQADPANPYRQLLNWAGCEEGDLAALVEREGVEGALGELYRSGVYLTVGELKGHQPVQRGSATLTLRHGLPRHRRWHVPSSLGGGLTPLYQAMHRSVAVNRTLIAAAHGGDNWRMAYWGVPGPTAILAVAQARVLGCRFVRWFAQVDTAEPDVGWRVRWGQRGLRATSLLAGQPLPAPRRTPLAEPEAILDWLVAELASGQTPCLTTFCSAAVRLAQAAVAAGHDLTGAQLIVGGEPLTARRRELIERSGARILLTYASVETGPIATGCQIPSGPDDLHLLRDRYALIQSVDAVDRPGLRPNSLLVSGLRPSWPLVVLNLSLGDCAVVERRACGCPLEALSWTTHLREVRSYEKLTAGGMTFIDTDVIRVLEEWLPARFGGGPTDYQLLEDEADDGQPRLRLLVRPEVGPLDPAVVAGSFLAQINDQDMLWRQTDWLRVERRAPVVTSQGKIQHIWREAAASVRL